jgi:hypothetical protein
LGTTSLRSSTCFPVISSASVDNPVTFPPCRARLEAIPIQLGHRQTP